MPDMSAATAVAASNSDVPNWWIHRTGGGASARAVSVAAGADKASTTQIAKARAIFPRTTPRPPLEAVLNSMARGSFLR